VALEVLTQHLGDQRRAVAYFSKQLDNVSQGWPGCFEGSGSNCHPDTGGPYIHPWAAHCGVRTPRSGVCAGTKGGTLAIPKQNA
uniref:Uncharacterized protein n=1 Tax=Malurus cyaneus samueli TaxID=2593467 RepID=A0A8C5U2N6_9PASS